MFGGALLPARRRPWLRAIVVAMNVPLFVHLVFPGWVGLTRNAAPGSMRLAVAAPRETNGSDCTDLTERAPIRAYLSGQVCAPPDFPYEPILRQTMSGPRMMDPLGTCSSALGDTGRSFDFAAACDGHDYGYDLLRFFGIGGAERRVVDEAFGAALWDSCRGRPIVTRFNCYGWAAMFDWINRGNSVWRQHEVPRGVIGNNSVSDWSVKAVQVLVAADIGLGVWMLGRRRRARAARPDTASVPQPVFVAGGR